MKEIYEMKGSGRSTWGIAQELEPYAEHIDWRMGEGLENCRVLDKEVRSLGYQGNSSEPPPWPASKSRQLPARWRSTFTTRDPR